MSSFADRWAEAAWTSVGLFWTAFWAFGLGYLVSSMIQVFVTRARMRRTMGESGPRSVGLGTFFGFISSSCSFAALATTRALFVKGAGLVPSLAFLLASTNLVIELGIIIAVFLSWQFVVGEYVGGLLLIALMWGLVRLTLPSGLVDTAREHASEHTQAEEDDAKTDWKQAIRSVDGWRQVARRYAMEWLMVWKDVTVGFTVAGVIAAFLDASFFEALFPGAGSEQVTFGQVLAQSLVGPVAAFVTFIGSMGNIPLAAVLFSNGVSFAGIMAFIFSDLVVFPVLRIQAKYYGWKMALYIVAVFLVVLVTSAIVLHYGFDAVGALPSPDQARSVTDREFFAVDYTLVLNAVFVVMTAGFAIFRRAGGDDDHEEHDHGGEHDHGSDPSITERVLLVLAIAAFVWIAGGLVARVVTG